MLHLEANSNRINKQNDTNGTTGNNLSVLFNLNYCEKGNYITQILDYLILNSIGDNVRLLSSIIKEFSNGKPLVVMKLPLNGKLNGNIIHCILQDNTEKCFLLREELAYINTLKSQFPKDYNGLRSLLRACQHIDKPLKQRYDLSGKGYGTELYF